MTSILTNVYWAYGIDPDIRFNFSYESEREGADMLYRFNWVFHSLNTPQSGFGWPIYATVKLDGSTKLNGITLKGTSPMKWFDSKTVVYTSDWVRVSGKAEGTVAYSMQMFSGMGMSRSQTWTGNIDILPASSPFTCSDSSWGGSLTVSIQKAKEEYRHTVTLKIKGDQVAIKENVDTSATFSISIDWLSRWTDPDPEIEVFVSTFEGSSQIGVAGSQIIKPTVPASAKPTLSRTLTKINDFNGIYIEGRSAVKVTAAPSLKYGAMLSKCEVRVGDEVYSGTEYTSRVLPAGSVTIKIVITDSRGYSASKTDTISVSAYSAPTITVKQPFRCLSNKTFSESGTYAYIDANATYQSNISGNSCSIEVSYRKRGDYTYSNKQTWEGSSVTVAACSGSLLLSNAYEVLVRAVDSVGGSASFVGVILSSANYGLVIKGKKAKFFGYPDSSLGDGLQIQGNLYVSGRTYAPTTFFRLLNEVVEVGGVRVPALSNTYSFFVAVVMRSNGTGGRHTEFVPAVYVDVERIFSPYIYNGNKDFSLQYSGGVLTVKNQSSDELRITIYGVV